MTPPKSATGAHPQLNFKIPAPGASNFYRQPEGEAASQVTPEYRGPSSISIALEIPLDGGKVSLLLGHRKIPLDKLRENLASEFHQTQEPTLLQGLKHFLGGAVAQLREILEVL